MKLDEVSTDGIAAARVDPREACGLKCGEKEDGVGEESGIHHPWTRRLPTS